MKKARERVLIEVIRARFYERMREKVPIEVMGACFNKKSE